MLRWFGPVGLLGLAGCGLLENAVDRKTIACDLRSSTLSPQPYCQEWQDTISSPGSNTTPMATCATLGAEFIDGPCPAEGILAGCFLGNLGDGSRSVWWYYESEAEGFLTEDDVRAECVDEEGEFEPFEG